jgi:hypothetical protein
MERENRHRVNIKIKAHNIFYTIEKEKDIEEIHVCVVGFNLQPFIVSVARKQLSC